MTDDPSNHRIAGLLQDARLVRKQPPEACAAAIGCALAEYDNFESGAASPSLPALEMLAYFLDVPVSYFWGDLALSEQAPEPRPALPAAELAALRNRIIGVQLRQARLAAHLSPEGLAVELGLPAQALTEYESGRAAVPFNHLSALAERLKLPLDHFIEARGPAGEWETTLRALERVRQLPPELREFVSQPVNESYLRLARQLSQLPADRLRGIAASLLEITY
jgi:transcriptional regulator with XRE-family HTH domain